MCNCGNKRNGLVAQSSALSSNTGAINQPVEKMWPDISFVYTGQSALTITGYISGKRYRFNAPGERQLIDYRDASSMMTVPVLKRVV